MTPETKLRLKLLTLGYEPIPARGKRVFLDEWSTETITSNMVKGWETGQHRRDINTGVRTGRLVGVDIDCLDPAMSKKLKALAFDVLGPTQFVRVGMAPKTLLAYRNETPMRKMETGRKNPKDKTSPNVEILGLGQQFIAYGIHPDTKKLYNWTGMSLADMDIGELPEVIPDVIEYFIEKAAKLLGVEAHGTGSTVTNKKGKKAAPLSDEELEDLRSAVGSIPNDLTHDQWVRFGHALKHTLGDAGLDLFIEFSEKFERDDASGPERSPEKVWAGIKPDGRITQATIFKLARDKGWKPGADGKERTKIRLVAGREESIVDKVETAVVKAGLGIYKQGSRLVRPIWNDIITSTGPGVVMRVADIEGPTLREQFPRAVEFNKWAERQKEWVVANCPKSVVEIFMARGDWKLRYLLGVTTAPTLRKDGSVLDTVGYDAASGLVYNPYGVEFPKIPSKPTRRDALQALEVLRKPIAKFPFVTKQDEAVALSCIFTAVVRRAFPVAPLHGFSAPAAGTGKSFLVDIASAIATGERVAVMSMGQDSAEFEKRLTAQALAGELIISIDNIDVPLQGNFLAQMITQEKVSVRPLGSSNQIKIPNTSFLCATGNNLIVKGDMTRRAVMCNIDSKEERPELRRFNMDPVDYCKRHRPALVAAVLTIIRAFIVSGKKVSFIPLGGFKGWTKFVQCPIIWLLGADPVKSMENIRENDPERDALRGLITAWRDLFDEREHVTVPELISVANMDLDEFLGIENPLHTVLLEIAGDRNFIKTKVLSWWLKLHTSRVVKIESGGKAYRLEIARSSGRHQKWRLVAVAENGK